MGTGLRARRTIDHFVMAITAAKALQQHTLGRLQPLGKECGAWSDSSGASYRKLLREAKDEAGRRLIRRLLTEEEQKEATPLSRPRVPGGVPGGR
jgi:hypothetical protein